MSDRIRWRHRLPAVVALLLMACGALVVLGGTVEHREEAEGLLVACGTA